MELQRFNCGLDLKLAGGNAEAMEFSGYGAVFGNVDSYGDVIAPGAFAETLAAAKSGGHWPVMLSQHGGFSAEDMTPIGVWTDLSEDGVGLRVTGKLANTPRGKEAYELLKMTPRPAIDGMSIGYIAKEWTPRSKPEEPRRTLKKIDLYEISLVTFPANGKARVKDVKSIDELLSPPEMEDYLREVGGFSKSEAKMIMHRMKAIGLREVDHDSDLTQMLNTVRRR